MRNDFLTQALTEHRERRGRASSERDTTTTIGGTTVKVGPSETVQSLDDSFLVGSNLKGVPRGREAFEAREISETAPFQMILNAAIDQLLGGDLVFPSDDEEEDSTEADLKAVVADVLAGPHHGGTDTDDLIASWVADMAGPGNAYAEPLEPVSDGVDLPFVALKDVDPLTVRHNVDRTGAFKEPAYYQAPFHAGAGGIASVSGGDIHPLEQDDLMVMSWPGSHRSNRVYPLPPALQVKEWLEILVNSTTHHGRFYSDNELPPGLLTVREATDSDVENIRDELEAAKGDPRAAPVVGTDARWVEVGGSAVDLNVVEEQKWFLQLVMAAFGITKTELAMDEQVNYETSEAMLTVVGKRVTKPLSRTISQAIRRQLLPQFEVYKQLDQPFDVELRYTDPRQERADEQQARERYKDGAITYREYRELVGDDMSDVETVVEIGGATIDYGEYPKYIVDALLQDASSAEPAGPGGDGDGGGDDS